jgi:glycosyltransferase involved in cell wall biosynthesis
MAEALIKARQSPENLSAITQRGRRHVVEKFSLQKQMKNLCAIYEGVL